MNNDAVILIPPPAGEESQTGSFAPLRMTFVFLSVLFLSLAIIPAAFANVLGNSDFSQPLGNGTASNWADNPVPTSVAQMGRWDGTNDPVGLSAGFAAPTGSDALFLQAYYNATPNPDFYEGTFTFQTYSNVKAGDYVTFSAYAQSDVKAADTGGRLKIEFHDSSDAVIGTATESGKVTALTAAPGSWHQFSISAIAPEGTVMVVFVLDCNGVAPGVSPLYGNTLYERANAEVNPAKLTVTASKRNVSAGDAVGINASFTNASGNTLSDVEMQIKIPHGFDYAKTSILMNGGQANYQEQGDLLIIPIGTMAPGSAFSASGIALVTSGVKLGSEYSMEFTLVGSSDLSETASLKFLVQGDPVFDQGTIIGKVFNDINQNTIQDKGEEGVPWVRLYTEEGIGIVTDENGLYHIPGVSSGRHVVKIDGHSLPDGTKFITEEAYLVKTTAGIMNKANFAVLLPPSGIPENFQKELKVMVTQGVDVSRPSLDVQISPDVVKLGVGVLEKEPVFTFDNNYGKFIKKWTVGVRDEMGQPVWTGYGIGQPPAEVTWSGIAESGLLIKPGIYSYQLKVRDAK
ncbi:MAG: hypothetical protein PHV97_07000, partial [Candidatus Omnitrophica bacterium]|nr:hypothetical protein [Candidatus Omnitrophota bacterium]